MSLRRSFLILAAGLSVAGHAANVTVDVDQTISSSAQFTDVLGQPNNFVIGNAELTIDLRNLLGSPIDATLRGRLLDGPEAPGILVKTGGGTLQYDGFSNIVYFKNASFGPALLKSPSDLNTAGAFSGIVIVEQGQLEVSGYLSQWADYGARNAALGLDGATMVGASAVVVEGGAKLSFRNSSRNLVGVVANLADEIHDNPGTPLVARLNFAHNLLAATTSRVETGPTDDYILVVHSDFAAADLAIVTESTMGVLEGRGRVYKTGADALRITNTATFSGEFVAAGGRVILDAASGSTLWSALSVNLASGPRGGNMPGATNTDPGTLHWKPGYAPGGQTTTLVVNGDQRIRNFQSLFGEAGINAVVLAGRGAGNLIELANAGDILRITQEANFDGIFEGSFVGAVDEGTGLPGQALGRLEKNGAGTLALMSEGNNFSRLDIQAGRIVANVQSLGGGDVFIAGGAELSIVQNNAGALRARIISDSALAELRFKPYETVRYRGVTEVQIGNDDAGVADIFQSQSDFRGRVIVEDGNAIVFSAGNSDAFANASRIQLLGGPSGRETSIRFNDTDQRFRDLDGEAGTAIYLGRGDITVVAQSVARYNGTISGVGNFIKSGSSPYTLGGANTYFGATVVAQGALNAATAGIGNTSGLVLAGASSFAGTGAQSVGGLFGQSTASVTVSGNLTIGVGDDLRGRLVSELASLPGTVPTSAAYYLATETADLVFGFSADTTLGYLARQYGLAPDLDLDGSVGNDEVAAFVASLDDEGRRDLLSYAGTLTVAGNLAKVGAERLRLTGSVALTGPNRTLDIQGGVLEARFGVITGVSRINLGASGTYALVVDSDQTLATPVAGDGTFSKLGDGRLDLDAAGSQFTGLYDVQGGILAVTFAAGGTPGVSQQGDVSVGEGTAFIAKVASDLSWAGEVLGEGDFAKEGAGTLTLSEGRIFTTGLTDVREGGLVVAATPESDLNIEAGATFTAALVDDDFYDAVLSGTGTFVKAGDFDLRLDTAHPFAGTFNVTAGSLSLFAADALADADALNLAANTTLRIFGAASQTLSNVSADASATLDIELEGTSLVFRAAAGVSSTFSARILGFPDITKTGDGKLSFLRPDDSANEIATIDIQGGELEASIAGLGGADVNIGSGATLRFFADEGANDAYAFVITGTGKVAKSGLGTVDLRDADLADIEAVFDIQGGTLVVSEAALGDGAAPRATLANGATFAYLATNDASLSAADITGSGTLTLGGYAGATPVLTLQGNLGGTVGYTGLTSLVDGVSVTLATGLTALPGLAAESGTVLSTGANTTLAVTQSVDATFAGDLLGNAALTLRGTGLLDVTGNGGNLAPYGGTVTVDGGKLGVSTANTKAISLLNGATLVLSGGAPTNYTGALTGTGATLELRDGVTIDLTPVGALALSTLDNGAFSRISLLEGSTLRFALGASSLDKTAALDVAGGSLAVVVNQPSSILRLSQLAPGTEATGTVSLAAATGFAGAAVTIEGDIAGDLAVSLLSVTLRGDVGGDVAVAPATSLVLGAAGDPVAIGGSVTVQAGSILSGAGTIGGTLDNAGSLTPGFSPGTLVVGDLVNSGALFMELGALASDQILFSGTASLNDGGTGVLVLSPYGAGSLHGIRHVLLRDTAQETGVDSFLPASNLGRFNGVSTGTLRVLLVYPDALRLPSEAALASLSREGEVAAYAVRAPEEYDLPSLPSSWLTRLRAITTVNQGTATLGPQFNAMGARLAILGDAQLAAAVDNLRPAAQASLATGAIAGFRANADAVLRRLEARRFDAAGPSVLTNDWFVEGTNAKVDVDSGLQARHTGLTAGVIHEFGFDGYWGYNLGVDTADTEGAAGSFDGNGFRLGLFGGFMNQDRDLSLDFGVSFGSLNGDLTRASVFDGRNVANPDSTTVGAWVRLTSATTLGRSLAFTPFAQLETSRTNLGGLSETGQDDALEVDDADLSQTALRLGFGLHRSWTSDTGAWNYRLALEVAYNLQLTGDDLDLAASIPEAGFSQASSNFGVLPGNGFTLAPSFSFGTSPDSTFNVGLRLDQASEGDALSIQFGYRRKF